MDDIIKHVNAAFRKIEMMFMVEGLSVSEIKARLDVEISRPELMRYIRLIAERAAKKGTHIKPRRRQLSVISAAALDVSLSRFCLLPRNEDG